MNHPLFGPWPERFPALTGRCGWIWCCQPLEEMWLPIRAVWKKKGENQAIQKMRWVKTNEITIWLGEQLSINQQL